MILSVVALASASQGFAAVDDYIGKPIASVHLVIEGRDTTDPVLTRVVEPGPAPAAGSTSSAAPTHASRMAPFPLRTPRF